MFIWKARVEWQIPVIQSRTARPLLLLLYCRVRKNVLSVYQTPAQYERKLAVWLCETAVTVFTSLIVWFKGQLYHKTVWTPLIDENCKWMVQKDTNKHNKFAIDNRLYPSLKENALLDSFQERY